MDVLDIICEGFELDGCLFGRVGALLDLSNSERVELNDLGCPKNLTKTEGKNAVLFL